MVKIETAEYHCPRCRSKEVNTYQRRLRQFRANIEAVCMDMSNASAKWVTELFPNATVVYDHFHVIKLVNEKLDQIRRDVQNKLNDENRKELKGKCRHLLSKATEKTTMRMAASSWNNCGRFPRNYMTPGCSRNGCGASISWRMTLPRPEPC